MKKQNPGTLLIELIQAKEAEHQAEGKLLKEHLSLTYESLRPVNIIKSTFKEMISSPDLKTNFMNTAIGVSAGFIAKKAFMGKSHNLLIKLSGVLLEMVIASKISSNANEIKAIGSLILKKISNKNKDTEKAV